MGVHIACHRSTNLIESSPDVLAGALPLSPGDATASGPAVGVQSTARIAPPAVTLVPAIWPNSFRSLGCP